MKNPVIIFIGIVGIIVLGIGAFTLSQNSSQSDSKMQQEGSSIEPTNAMMRRNDSANEGMQDDGMSTSQYVAYSKEVFDSASANRRVLFFYASWCPTCIPADTSFHQNVSKIPSDVIVIRVNYNDPETDQEEKDLAKKYGITYQHTFVQLDNAGNEVTKWNGGQIDELLSKIQ